MAHGVGFDHAPSRMIQSKRRTSSIVRPPKRPPGAARARSRGKPRTLTIDVGGTGIKMLVLDEHGKPVNQRSRQLTPKPASPAAVLATIATMLKEQPRFDRVSAGFPGVVTHGVVKAAANLGTELWSGHDLRRSLEALTQAPVRVLNDAELQGYGVIQGRGVEMVLTLGTGIGVALYTSGHLVPNCELGHHPWRKGKTYEQRLSDAVLRQIGKRRWGRRVGQMIAEIEPIFNYDTLYLGGGNARHLKLKLPANVKVFSNVDGMTGGLRMWRDDVA
jgi:polyphosphate glucokinase